MKLRPGFYLCLLLSTVISPACWSATGDDVFAQGVAAFREGRYDQALQLFQQARQEGNASTQLLYNLGVTNYRLGDYAAARAAFAELTQSPDQAALAHYNLGLVALKTGDTAQARREFGQARQGATKPALRRLADEQLRRLGGATPHPPRGDRLSGTISVGGGYDSNVVLAPDDSVLTNAQRDSRLASVQASVRLQLAGSRRNGLQLAASYSGLAYSDVEQHNLDYARLGPRYVVDSGTWRLQVGASGTYIGLGGNTVETMAGGNVKVGVQLSRNNQVELEYRYDQVEGAEGYDQLSGWRQSLRFEHEWSPGRASLSWGYRGELNRRNDLSRPPEFFSTSPTRERPFVAAGWRFTDSTRLRLEAQYERSRYDKPNQVLQGVTLVTLDREDERYNAILELTQDIGRRWSLTGQYRYTDNLSTIPSDEYTVQHGELRLGYRF